ncbi:MAG: AsmA-like C-terminal domain-containing protein, partial [Rhodospirillales bacterium]
LDIGDVKLINLGSDNERAVIDASATGPFASIARLLSHPKVGLPPNSVVAPARAGGQIAARLLLQFPLLDKLTMKQLEFSASASTRGLSLKDVVPGIDLTDGTLTLQLNGQEMDVRGRAKVAGVAADVSWHENFGRVGGVRRRFQLKGTAEVVDFARLGIPLSPYVTGAVGVTAIYQDNLSGGGTLDASLDFKQAALALPELNWKKPAGADAGGRVSFEVQQGKWPSEVEIQLRTADLDLKGRVAASGGVQSIAFDRLVSGRNDLSGTVTRTATGYTATLKGTSLDLAPFLADDTPSAEPPTPKPATGPTLDLTLDLRRILTKRGEIDAVVGQLRLQNGKLVSGALTARAPPAAMVQLTVTPTNQGRAVSLTASDMGAVLKSLGWLEGMFGGKAKLGAVFDDAKPNAPLRGQLIIDEYRLQKTPVVGDVLTVGELTDALSSLSGSGIEFNQLIAPFVWENGVLTLRGARTAGSSLGITASGRIDTNSDTVQIEGAIVPAYVINDLIGKIPLLGPLITGGQGKGLFAINYAVEGPIAKPRVSTNPLSALAPGFLRGLFGAGGSDDGNWESNQPQRPANEPARP